MKRSIIIIIFLILGILLIWDFSGLHFKEVNTIPGNVKLIRSMDNNDGAKALLVEDINDKTFGVARVREFFGFLYRYDDGSLGNSIGEGKPFQADGIGGSEYFLVVIKSAENSNIEYYALGNPMEDLEWDEPYELTLDDVKANIDDYSLGPVVDDYVLFVTRKYSEENWTIRAFDKDGILVADKLAAGDIRHIKWNR